MEKQASIKELAHWLKDHDDYVLMGHVHADGDAEGSCMAAMMALRALGKRAFVCLPDPAPKMYDRFPLASEIVTPADDFPFVPQTAFSIDVSEQPRLGAAEKVFLSAEHRAMLDHHATNPGFGEIYHVDGNRVAAGELVLELIEALGVELTKDMATWLLIAISTDSGHFRFSSTTPATFRGAAKLLEAGVDLPGVTREVWFTRTKARTLLMGVVLSGLQVSDDGLMAWAKLTKDMMAQCGATGEDKEGIVNYLLEIEGVEFAALAEEQDGGVKFSLRAKQWLNVADKVAKPFGGGGHAFAAGCFLPMNIDDALERVLDAARKALDNH